MSKSRQKITEELIQIRRQVDGKLRPFIPRPRSIEFEETVDDAERIRDLKHGSGLLVKDGQPVFVYIRDHLAHHNINDPKDRNKIHFSFCHTLTDMVERGRFRSRYRIATHGSDLYPIDYNNTVRSVRLYPCFFCLRKVNYKCFASIVNRDYRNNITKQFKAQDAVDLLKQHLDVFHLWVKNKNIRPDHVAAGYANDHESTSKEFRKSKNYTCEECGVDLSFNKKDQKLTDMHHIDGDKRNNDRENLKCLCKLCHRDIHHHYYVNPNDEKRIKSLQKNATEKRTLF